MQAPFFSILLISAAFLFTDLTLKAQTALPAASLFVHWEGGPLELKRRHLLGQLPSDNPQLKEAITGWYKLSTLTDLKNAAIDGIWQSWSIGLTEQEEEQHDAAASAYLAECHRAGIAVLATVSAGQLFLSTEEAATATSKLLRDPSGKPILCSAASSLAASPLQCYQPDLRDTDWKAQVVRRSSAAINAGADGVVLEGLSSPHYESNLVADFCNEMQRSLRQLGSSTSARLNTSDQPRQRSGPVALPVLSRSRLGQHWETPWLVLASQIWPGVRSSTASLVDGEIVVAGASQSPWTDSNLWLLNCAGAFSAGKPLFLTYIGSPEDPPSLASRGTLRLALAEAAALGTSPVLPLEDTLRQSLFERNAESLDEWNAVARYHRFFRSHPEVMQMKPVHNVAVIVDGCESSAEMLNLMSRRRLLYDIIPKGEYLQTSLEPYALLIINEPPPWGNDLLEKTMSFVRRGGIVVTTAAGLPSGNQLKSLQKVEENTERVAYSSGKGRWVVYRETFPDPDTFANEVKRLLGPDLQPVRLWNGSAVLAHLAQSPGSNQRALHLLNYGIDPVEELQVQVKGSCRKGEILSPDQSTPVPLKLSLKPGSTEFTIPSLGIYALVLLE
jgi:hypothetical protein